MSGAPGLRLGLIGDNIAASRAPLLHRLAGGLTGLEVRYDRLVPEALGLGFDEVFAACARGGYRGINVTYPYKERAARKVPVADADVRAIGAVNTVIFTGSHAEGFNTDHSGFIAAYRAARGTEGPGAVCVIGAGGAGRAIAFGLLTLGAAEIRLFDRNPARAAALAGDLRKAAGRVPVVVAETADAAAARATGLVNCTPVGMIGHEGTPLRAEAMRGARWAFDAVYTPVDTVFLGDAARMGATTISGYELFFHQGVHAWALFAGRPVDPARLRAALDAAAGEAA